MVAAPIVSIDYFLNEAFVFWEKRLFVASMKLLVH
jgi:hypothetical protein